MLEKTEGVKTEIDDRGLNTLLEVDGGVTQNNVDSLIEAGANVFVAGSAVFKGDPSANIAGFLKHFEEAERGSAV